MTTPDMDMWIKLRERFEEAVKDLPIEVRMFDVAIPDPDEPGEQPFLKVVMPVDMDQLLGLTVKDNDDAEIEAKFRQMMAEDREREEHEKIEAGYEEAMKRLQRRKGGPDEPDS